jgi:MoaA/NifB/PqqE/SkfB family radical SAM enzyme
MKKERRGTHFGFYGRLNPIFPSQIIVDVTEKCNLECLHCAHKSFVSSTHYTGSMLNPGFNVKLVKEVSAYGRGITQYIRYCADGEPLLHPRILEMLEFAVRYSGVNVTLTTNGTLMNGDVAKMLVDMRIHVVDISIDAYSEKTYAKIRRNGDLSITKANVLRLIGLVKRTSGRTKVVVSYIEQEENYNERERFKNYWMKNGADYVVLRRLHSTAGALPDVARSMKLKIKNECRRPCLYPWERIVLNPIGYLCFCPADWQRKSSIVDYAKTSIREVWAGRFYRSLREAHLHNDFRKHPFCKQCPDWCATRWPDEGRSYADMVEEFKNKDQKEWKSK